MGRLSGRARALPGTCASAGIERRRRAERRHPRQRRLASVDGRAADPVAVEIDAPSLTSQNLDEKLGVAPPRPRSSSLRGGLRGGARPRRAGARWRRHGYVVIDIDADRIRGEWWHVDTVLERTPVCRWAPPSRHRAGRGSSPGLLTTRAPLTGRQITAKPGSRSRSSRPPSGRGYSPRTGSRLSRSVRGRPRPAASTPRSTSSADPRPSSRSHGSLDAWRAAPKGRQKSRQKIGQNRSRASEQRTRVLRARDEAAANAHDLPSQVARPRGFEPLTFGSVDRQRVRRLWL